MCMSMSIDCPFLIVISLTSFLVHVNVSVSRFLIPDCSMNGQSRDIDIDIHKNKTLEMEQSGMDNLEKLTLTYTRKRR
jgi:hypothetical protein